MSISTRTDTSKYWQAGGAVGFVGMLAFPHNIGPAGNAIVGAVCVGGASALGGAVASLVESWSAPQAAPEGAPNNTGSAIASLVLGILGLIAAILPIAGLPVTITGFCLGKSAVGSKSRGMALAGMTLSLIGLMLAAVNGYFGALMAVRMGASH